jgi:serine/threonine protein kinase
LKPENVLFLKKDSLELKIIDFGLAFEWEHSMPKELSKKSSKNVVGTVNIGLF